MKKYDIVIVGGGIAGSVSARYLAKFFGILFNNFRSAEKLKLLPA